MLLFAIDAFSEIYKQHYLIFMHRRCFKCKYSFSCLQTLTYILETMRDTSTDFVPHVRRLNQGFQFTHIVIFLFILTEKYTLYTSASPYIRNKGDVYIYIYIYICMYTKLLVICISKTKIVIKKLCSRIIIMIYVWCIAQ